MKHITPLLVTLAIAGATIFINSCKKELPDEPAPVTPTSSTTITGTNWTTVGDEIGGAGYCLEVFDNKLFVGGNFFTIGTSPTTGVAYYNGTAIVPVYMSGVGGSGFSSFGIHNAELYGGGGFSQFLGLTGCGKWDGTTWDAGTYSMNSNVYAIQSYSGSLVVGGYFTAQNSLTYNRIAIHNGSGWDAMGAGFDNTVYALAVYNNELYAAGQFQNSGSTPVSRIAKWNGSAWVAVGTSGLNGPARAMTVYNGALYVAGSFTTADGSPARYLAKWDGSNWSDVGGSLTGGFNGARSLTTYGGELFVGGDFTGAGTATVLNIARWNGSAWSAVGTTGVTGIVSALKVFNSGLYALQSTYTTSNYLLKFQ